MRALTDEGEPVPPTGIAMAWNDEESVEDGAIDERSWADSKGSFGFPGTPHVDPIEQVRAREQERRRRLQLARDTGREPRPYEPRSAVLRAQEGGLTRPEQLHATASRIAGGSLLLDQGQVSNE